MSWDLPVKIEVGEDRLSPSGDRLLGELEDHHLGQLLQVSVRHPHEIGCKKEINGIPANRPSKMTLQGCGKLHHVGEQHLWMLGRFGRCNRVGKAQAKAFNVFEGLAATIRPINKTEIVEMDIPAHMCVGNIL
jgi:hypothetical protein